MEEKPLEAVQDEKSDPIAEMRATLDKMAVTVSAFEAKQLSAQHESRRERAYLDFLSDLATAIGFSVAGAYTLHHPRILFDNPWLAAVCGTLVYMLGAGAAAAAASQYINVLYLERAIERRRRWFVLFVIVILMAGCYAASWLAFSQPLN